MLSVSTDTTNAASALIGLAAFLIFYLNTMPNLSDAITNAEQALSSYNSATTTTENDQVVAAGIKSKLDAATQQVSVDQGAQDQAAQSANQALDALIDAATAAKIVSIIEMAANLPQPPSV